MFGEWYTEYTVHCFIEGKDKENSPIRSTNKEYALSVLTGYLKLGWCSWITTVRRLDDDEIPF